MSSQDLTKFWDIGRFMKLKAPPIYTKESLACQSGGHSSRSEVEEPTIRRLRGRAHH